MRLGHLIVQEIRYRKLNFALGTISVVVAVGCAVGFLATIRAYDLRTDRILKDKEAATRAAMARLEDDYRKISLRMGFNMAIVPKAQSVADFFAEDGGSNYMPESYADRLAQRKVATINHVLPVLQQKIVWREQQRPVLMTGVRGEVWIQDKLRQKPMLEAVEQGEMLVGYVLARDLNLKAGDRVKFMGREFAIRGVRPGRGSKDDIAVWINLAEAQRIAGKPGLINSILALECECSVDRLAAIRREVGTILPDTQVIEFANLADARSESRRRAADAAQAAVAQERQNLERLRGERLSLARMLIPVVVGGSVVWILFLMLGNVRDRGGEIGILRAIGLRSWQVLAVFLGKALLMGLIGGCTGYVAGRVAGGWRQPPQVGELLPLFQASWLLAALAAAPALAVVASLVPALMAAYRDPAVLLRETI